LILRQQASYSKSRSRFTNRMPR